MSIHQITPESWRFPIEVGLFDGQLDLSEEFVSDSGAIRTNRITFNKEQATELRDLINKFLEEEEK